jgi:hypothetical protein
MVFPGAHSVRRRPQGLGVARDVSAPRIGDLSVRRTSGVFRSRIGLRAPDWPRNAVDRHRLPFLFWDSSTRGR